MWVRVKCSMQHTGEHHTLISKAGMVGERGLPAHEALRAQRTVRGHVLLVFINGQRAGTDRGQHVPRESYRVPVAYMLVH